ncbi:MAG: hypothetical protein H0X02_04870 [Nitrosomonas sp.]|nr:hypothetical protein [Nitrosomonas sp.]
MPFNDKKQWVNPPENPFDIQDQDRGFSECNCGEGVHLHQAGYDAQMKLCGMCKSEVADADDFFSQQPEARKHLRKGDQPNKLSGDLVLKGTE